MGSFTEFKVPFYLSLLGERVEEIKGHVYRLSFFPPFSSGDLEAA